MTLVDCLEKYGADASFTHRSLGEGVTAKVTHKTQHDFVLELSNGHALVRPMDDDDAGWSVHLKAHKKRLQVVMQLNRNVGGYYWTPLYYENISGLKFDANLIRVPEKDFEVEVYE